MMQNADFVQMLRSETDDTWRAILSHPFVQGIGDGSLSRERFVFYLKQDYRYLIQFSRLLALGVAKGNTLAEMRYLCNLLDTTLNLEMEMHRRVCADFDITSEDLENTDTALVTHTYTDFLVRTASEGVLEDIIAVLLPCALGYVEVARHLSLKGLPDNAHYRAWIDTYTSEEMNQVCEWLREKMNELAMAAPRRNLKRWQQLYHRSATYELLFFEMGWTMNMGFPVDVKRPTRQL